MKLVFQGEIDVLISVNKMYGEKYDFKRRRTVKFLLPAARKWKDRAKIEFALQYAAFPQRELTKNDIYQYCYEFSFPDGHTRDAENYLKIITDAIQDAGIIKNESQIRKGMFLSKIDRAVPYKKVNISLYQES